MIFARSLVLRMLARILALVLRSSGRRAGIALVYHALAEHAGDTSRELVPPHATARFEAHVLHLRAAYRLVRAAELVEAVLDRRRWQRFPVAITFDDDLRSHVQLAAPLLRRLGAPATFFLCGASLDKPYAFWWERLQRAFDEGVPLPVEGQGIHEIAGRVESMSVEERERVEQWLVARTGTPKNAGLRLEDVQELVDARLDLGFHTLRHHRLTELDDEALRHALTEGRPGLERVSGNPLVVIAYPHGKADARVARAAGAAGFHVGFSGRHEPVVPSSDPLLLGRVEPTFGSDARFTVQLARTLLRRPHR
jgi:peptidoglycan/xylan/chitin deacetylase (PgdA/CDA1 family)